MTGSARRPEFCLPVHAAGGSSRLRQKLGEDGENPTYIFSEPRVGYRMAVGETRELSEQEQETG